MNWPDRQISYSDAEMRLLSNTPMQFLIGAALLALGLATEIPWMHEYSAAILVIRLSLVFGMLACALVSARFPTRGVTEMLIFGGMIISIIGMAILGDLKNTYLETSTQVVYQSLAFIAIFMSIRLPIFAILVTSVGILWFGVMPFLLQPQLNSAMLISHFFGYVCYAAMVLIGKHLMLQLMCAEKRQSKQLAQMEELQKLAIRDISSGAYNQQYFQKLLPEYAVHARDCKKTFSLCLLALPDTSANQSNEKSHSLRLQRFRRTIQDMMRSEDKVFRIGKSLFAFLLPDTKAANAAIIAERIREQWQVSENINCQQFDNNSVPGCVIGISEFHSDTSTTASLLQSAEKAVSTASTPGNKSIVIN